MDPDTIINENINIGIFKLEKQEEATIDVYEVYKKISDERKKTNDTNKVT